MRTENDFLGEMEIPDDKLFGIHALRAAENFSNESPFPVEWYRAIGSVKKACYITYRNFRNAAIEKNLAAPGGHQWYSDANIDALVSAANDVASGLHFDHFIVPALQGGAGTSINMNVNEIIANRALIISGHEPGQYQHIHPLTHANIYQSTNDVVPTALRVALMQMSHKLEAAINKLREAFELLEQTHRDELRQSYTQMQKAVPSSYGQLFGAYANAFSRDWWRISRLRERLKEVNLGSGAAGTGLGIPRYFILQVAPKLRELTNLPLAHSENLTDSTMNNDDLVESHGILKALAVNIEKTCNDLRLLGADISANKPLRIPGKQMGSSLMPGKVNPVIAEYGISVSHKVYANDQIITSLSALGCLDLNAYIPTIGAAMIESFRILESACNSMFNNMVSPLELDASGEQAEIFGSPTITTALVPYIGHQKAEELTVEMKKNKCTIFEANSSLKILAPNELKQILDPASLTAKGFTLRNT